MVGDLNGVQGKLGTETIETRFMFKDGDGVGEAAKKK